MSVLWVTRMSPGRMEAAMEMWVMTLAGPVTRPGHAGVPVTVTPPRPAPAFASASAPPPVRCSVAATWTGLPETSSGNCC